MDLKIKDWIKNGKNKYLLYISAFAAALFMIMTSGQKTADIGETALEKKLAQTLSCIEGVEQVTVAVSMQTEGADIFGTTQETGGVVVIADGTENSRVRSDIYEAVSALTGVPYHRIKIFATK